MEVMHTSTFNIDAALKGTGTDAVMTADLGRHSDKVDIIVRRKGDVLNVQAKNTVTDSTATLVRRTGDAKYSGCDQILVPEDKLGGLQDYAKGRLEKPSTNPNAPITAEGHKQIVEKATDRIEFKGTASKPMTGQKAKVYAENPGSAAKDLYMHGASRAVALGAGAGAFAACVSAATSKEQNPMKRAKEAGVVGLTVAGCSIATAAGTAALKALGRHGGQVFRPLVRGNVAAAVIEGGVCISNESYRYYKGECSGTEAFDHIAEKGSSMLGGFAAVTATGLALAALPAAPFLVATVAVTGLGIGGSLGGSYIYKAGKRFLGNRKG